MESNTAATDAVAPASASWSLSSLLAGPIAGVASRAFTCIGLFSAASAVGACFHGDIRTQIVQQHGLWGLYKGFPAVAIGNIPANAAYFSGYELGKKLVPGNWGMAGDMLVGVCAQLTGGLLFTPIDIVKERMQVQNMMQKAGVASLTSLQVLHSLVASNGGLFALFKGYWATNAVWIPWSMLHISLYEQLKDLARSSYAPSNSGCSTEKQDLLPTWLLGGCSAVSSATASFATHPLDVIKTRLQVLSSGRPGLTSWQVAKEALHMEGPKVFMAGAAARILTLAPGSAITWMVYEPAKNFLDRI